MNTTERILELLVEADGADVSGETVCERIGITRAAIWKHIQRLRAMGYAIEAQTRRGYRLTGLPGLPNLVETRPFLQTETIGKDLRFLETTGSTNRDCAKLAGEGEPEGVAVVAESQTAGRGRQTREWFSPKGVNLYFSLLLRPDVEFSRAASLPLVAGLAVAEAVESICPGLKPRIKWPNDILIGGKKVCGILCEMQAETAHVLSIIPGIGINVNLQAGDLPAELRDRATSLSMETGRTFSRPNVLAAVLNRFEPLYTRWKANGLAPLLPEIRERDLLHGTAVFIDRLGHLVAGTAAGIRDDGALLLKTRDGIVPVYSGEAHLRPQRT